MIALDIVIVTITAIISNKKDNSNVLSKSFFLGDIIFSL